MNLADMKVEVKRLTGRNDSGFDTRIEKALNRALRHWARSQPWDDLKRVIDITHPSGRVLYLPSEVERLVMLMDKTNAKEMEYRDQWDRMDAYGYANDRSNNPEFWRLAGFSPTFTTASGPLAIYSSDASDIASVYVTGQVLAAGGTAPRDLYELGETFSVVGATPVTGSNTFTRVTTISKAADITGVLTIQCQGTTVGHIGPYDLQARYPMVELFEIPKANTQFRARVLVRPPRLTAAYQAPPPSVDTDFLIWAAASDIHYQLGEGERSQAALSKAGAIMRENCAEEKMFGDWYGQIVPETEDDI
jgi:hypothetical protein